MTIILSLTIKIFILLFIGILACKLGFLDDKVKSGLSGLLINIILPVSMLASSQQKFDSTKLVGMGQVAVIAFGYYMVVFAVGIAVCRAFKVERAMRTITILLVAFANTAFLGIPILMEIAGETGMLLAVIFNCVFDLLYFSVGMYMLKKENDIKDLLKNPMIWISVLTVILYVIPYRVSTVIVDAMNTLGSTMMPISMLIIGAQLCHMDLRIVVRDKRVYFMSFLRMLLIPFVSLIIMRVLNVPYEVGITIVILNAMPSGSMNVIMAEHYDTHPEFATATVMQNTLLMLITLPAFMYLCRIWL